LLALLHPFSVILGLFSKSRRWRDGGLKGKGREEFMIHGKERNRVGTFDIISEGIYLACSA